MTETLSLGLLLVLIPVIALVAGAYASVGLGGSTGYLAVMTLLGMSASEMAPTALLLNIVVTSAALLRFGMAGRMKWGLFLPFLIPSIPAAFIGGIVTADRRLFFALMAAALAIASIGMLKSAAKAEEKEAGPGRFLLIAVAIPSGIVIGLLSGFLGIGGGVFLGWAGPRQVAAMNSALILVLSSVALSAHGM